MAGRQKITGWGGARAGSGRKPKYMMTDTQVRNMMKTARKKAKEYGRTLDEVLIDIAYGKEGKPTVKEQLAAIQIFKSHTMAKQSEQNITVSKDRGMAVRLPPKRPDPALQIVKGGKTEAKG